MQGVDAGHPLRLIYHTILILLGMSGYLGLATLYFAQVISRGRGSFIGLVWGFGLMLAGAVLWFALWALF